MSSNNKSNDFIVLKDFDNDGIFVISSNRHTQPQPMRDSSAPADTITENPKVNQSQSNLIQVPKVELSRYLAQLWQQSKKCFWGKWDALCSRWKSCLNWSCLQAWNATGYLTCTVPYRLVLEGNGEYQIKSNKIQKGLWMCHVTFALVELTRVMQQLKLYLNGEPNPFQYIKVVDAIVSTVAKISFLKATMFEGSQLLKIHQEFEKNETLVRLYSKKVGIAAFSFFLLCTIFVVMLYVMTYNQFFYNQWSFNTAELIQAFACYSKETFMWEKIEDCGEEILENLAQIPTTDVLWGVVGLAIYISGLLFQQSMIFLIFASALTLLQGVQCQRGTENGQAEHHQRLANYNFLKDISKNISKCVGFLVATQLVNVACMLPTWLRMMFLTRDATFLGMTVRIAINCCSFIAACVAALQIDEMEDEFAAPESIDELPNDTRALAGFFYKLLRKSVGIGFRGLFVLNFRFLVGYLGIIGTFITVLFESTNGKTQ